MANKLKEMFKNFNTDGPTGELTCSFDAVNHNVLEDMLKQEESFTMQAAETQEAFIFSTIQPYIQSITTMEISKDELVQAIVLHRKLKKAQEKYGVAIPLDREIHSNVTQLSMELDAAYMRGVKDGIEKERKRMKSYFEGDEE